MKPNNDPGKEPKNSPENDPAIESALAQCLFCKIIRSEIPCDKIYESEDFLAFKDINPQVKQHVLVIPKKHLESIESLKDCEKDNELKPILQEYLIEISKVAEILGLSKSGFRTVFNTNKDACQTVFHIHAHILGGEQLTGKMG